MGHAFRACLVGSFGVSHRWFDTVDCAIHWVREAPPFLPVSQAWELVHGYEHAAL